jgi:hypothetical protein
LEAKIIELEKMLEAPKAPKDEPEKRNVAKGRKAKVGAKEVSCTACKVVFRTSESGRNYCTNCKVYAKRPFSMADVIRIINDARIKVFSS